MVVGRVVDGAVAVVVGMVDKLGVVMGSVGKVVDCVESGGKQELVGKAVVCAGVGVKDVKEKPNVLGLAPFAVVGRADKVVVIVVGGAVVDMVVDKGL